MRITILIISILFSVVGFGQAPKGYVNFPYPIHECYAFVHPNGPKTIFDLEREIDTTKTPSVDSMDLKVISMNEFKAYMERIDLIIQKQFDLTKASRAKYEQIINAMNSVYAEADKKRKMK